MTTQKIGQEGFRWFFGIVEDVIDPMKLGRIRVRVLNEHDDNVDTDQLPWAQVLMPVTSASLSGVGSTPLGIERGSRVMGFFVDGNEKQMPMILGSFHTIPGNDQSRHSVNQLARGTNAIQKNKIGPEPSAQYGGEYPYNKVIQTRSGNTIEMDDTPGKERLHVYHNSGTYIEINNEGRVIIKTVTDSFDITQNNKTIFAGKDIDVIADGNITLQAAGGIKVKAPGGITMVQGSLYSIESIGSKSGATGVFSTPTGQTVHVNNGTVTRITG
jgi:hypothetical protein